MKHSPACTRLTASFEGFSSVAYQDVGGRWTIGYGRAIGVKPDDTCTQAQALQWLDEDLGVADEAVNRLVKVPLNQNQFDALVDFCFNVGQGSLGGSTLLRLLNDGDYIGASTQFLIWNKAAGKVLDGLSRRREAELALFDAPEVSA